MRNQRAIASRRLMTRRDRDQFIGFFLIAELRGTAGFFE